MRAVPLVPHHQSLFEHELHQLQRCGISTVLTQSFMHLAHGAGALTPQNRQDGYLGVGWKRRGSGLFGKGSGGHAPSIVRIYSYVNEKLRTSARPLRRVRVAECTFACLWDRHPRLRATPLGALLRTTGLLRIAHGTSALLQSRAAKR